MGASSSFGPMPDKVVVVLGNRLLSNEIHVELRGRMDTAIELWSTLSNSLFLVSGGRTNPSISKTEGEAMRDYATEKGVPSNYILVESEALDTIGNGYFTRKILDNFLDIVYVYTITSCYHAPRAEYIFKLCLGPKYILDSKTCFKSDRKADESERKGFENTQEFFSGITPGSIEEIGQRLKKSHSLYKDLHN